MTEVEQIHHDLLEKWRRAMNLVGPGPLAFHFEDSRKAVEGLRATGRWADLGSGAGFPGVALAEQYPDSKVVLVESRQKRAEFLKTLVDQLPLTNLSVFHGRAEDLEPGFDGAISRAFAPPDKVREHAQRLLNPGGRLVFLTREGEGRQYEVDGQVRVVRVEGPGTEVG